MENYLKEIVSKTDKEKINKFSRDLEKINLKQERLIDLYLDEKIDIENLNKKSALLDREKTIIQNKLNELNNIAKFNFNIEEIIIFLNDMKNKLNESDKKIKRTLIEAFVYKISINEDDVDIMLYLDNLINKNCDNIGGGEGNRTPVQA